MFKGFVKASGLFNMLVGFSADYPYALLHIAAAFILFMYAETIE